MKRLLAVILVLGMASTAKAVIIEIQGERPFYPENPATINVIGEDTSNWLGYIIVDEGGMGALSNGFYTELAGDPALAGITLFAEEGWGAGYELSVAGTASFPVGIGTLFTMDYSIDEGDVVTNPTTISLYIDPEYGVPAVSIYWPFYYPPEPPTEYGVYIQVDGKTGPNAVVEPDAKALITVVSEDDSNWAGYIIIEEGGSGELSNPVVLDAAGNLGSVDVYIPEPLPGYELTAAMSPNGVPPVAAGPQFNFDYSYSGDLAAGTTISLYVDPWYEVPAASVLIIPEPMTVVLLGLGGLFLRRRK
jgi:hypothetical protein